MWLVSAQISLKMLNKQNPKYESRDFCESNMDTIHSKTSDGLTNSFT